MKNLKPNKNKLSKKTPYLKTVPIHLWLTVVWIAFSIIHTEAQTISQFSTGTTFTQHTFKTNSGDVNTVNRGKALILNSTKIINQHLMGFGALDPEPTRGNYNFSSIENRIGKFIQA